MALSALVFWLCVLLTAGSALVVIGARNILHAGFALCLTFLGVAALYVFLHADFVAAVQLIVYVGGILVLIMFAVMFSSNVASDSSESARGPGALLFGAAAALMVFVGIFFVIKRLEAPLAARNVYAGVPYAPTVGVTPAVASKDSSSLLDANHDLVTKLQSLSPDKISAEIVSTLGSIEGPKFYDAYLLSKGESGIGHLGIGHKLIGEYVLPFEVVSILLLGALVGAVVIVRKELS